MSDFMRRIHSIAWCEAERKITAAMDEVERMGADVRLTDAVCLLDAARQRVADFIDQVDGRRTIPRWLTRQPPTSGHSPECRSYHGGCICGWWATETRIAALTDTDCFGIMMRGFGKMKIMITLPERLDAGRAGSAMRVALLETLGNACFSLDTEAGAASPPRDDGTQG